MKDNKHIIIVDEPEPTRQEIEGYKNFDHLLSQFKAVPKPFYTHKYFIGGTSVFTACIVGLVVFYAFFNHKGPKNIAQKPAENTLSAPIVKPGDESFIHPPIPGINVAYSYYDVDAVTGRNIHHFTGTRITVPPLAFANGSGELLHGKVTVRYREFHDMLDAYLSGIPMTYDSAGKKYDFQTAGMFDIQAFQDNKPVFMSPGKTIQVDMPSTEKGNRFSFYKLDNANKNWTYLGPDTSRTLPVFLADNREKNKDTLFDNANRVQENLNANAPVDELANVKAEDTLPIQYLKPNDPSSGITIPAKPYYPVQAKSFWSATRCRFSPSQCPELAYYKNVCFEKSNVETDCSRKQARELMFFPKIHKDKNSNTYYLEAPKKWRKTKKRVYVEEACRVIMYPVFRKRDLAKSMEKYMSSEATYETAVKSQKEWDDHAEERNKAEHARIDSLNRMRKLRITGYMADRQKEYQERLKAMSQKDREWAEKVHKADSIRVRKELSEVNYWNIRRSFEVSSFGVYNSDCKHLITNPVSFNISFEDADGKQYRFDQTFLVDKTRKFLHAYYNIGKGEKLTMCRGDRNVVFGVLPGNKIAMVHEKDLEQASHKSKAVLVLTFPNKTFENTEDVKAFLLKNEEGD